MQNLFDVDVLHSVACLTGRKHTKTLFPEIRGLYGGFFSNPPGAPHIGSVCIC